MHPQAQLPQSAAQRNAQAQQKKDQPEEFSQYQKYQEVGNVPRPLITAEANFQQQQRRQQEQEEQTATAPSSSSQASVSSSTTLVPSQQSHDSGSFMDMDYDYDQSDSSDSRPESRHRQEADIRHRPQSRASQHSQESGNGYANQAHASHHRRQQQQQSRGFDPQKTNPYQYQQSQFDEPARADDDDMW
ncbi:hypothetical protein P7C71_g3495, partial [Lecanoromycetidae sp. Uapishka_2]